MSDTDRGQHWGPRWGLNVGGFEKHYNVRLEGLIAGGWAARHKVDSRPHGPKIRARTLDELAELLETQP